MMIVCFKCMYLEYIPRDNVFSGSRLGLTRTYCEVYENETDVEICVGLKSPYENVACPVDFAFDLQFTIDSETGNHLDLFHNSID